MKDILRADDGVTVNHDMAEQLASGANGHIGLGAAYNFTPNLGVRAEWERLTHSEVDALSIGLQVRF